VSAVCEKHIDRLADAMEERLSKNPSSYEEEFFRVVTYTIRWLEKEWLCTRYQLLFSDSCSIIQLPDSKDKETILDLYKNQNEKWEWRYFYKDRHYLAAISISLCESSRFLEFCSTKINTPDKFGQDFVTFFPLPEKVVNDELRSTHGWIERELIQLLPARRLSCNEFCIVSCNTWCKNVFIDQLRSHAKQTHFSLSPYCCARTLEARVKDLRAASIGLARSALRILSLSQTYYKTGKVRPIMMMAIYQFSVSFTSVVMRYQDPKLVEQLWRKAFFHIYDWLAFLNGIATRIGDLKYLDWLHFVLHAFFDLLVRCNRSGPVLGVCFCTLFSQAVTILDNIIEDTDPVYDYETHLDALFCELSLERISRRLDCKAPGDKRFVTHLVKRSSSITGDVLCFLSLSKNSSVYRCYDFDRGEVVILKELFNDTETVSNFRPPQDNEKLIHEAIMLQSLHYRHIVDYIDLQILHDRAYIKMEYFNGESLLSYIRKHGPLGSPEGGKEVQEEILFQILFQVLMGLAFLHGHGIAHRDIKPENILIDEFHQVKLTDFGAANKVATTSSGCNNFSLAEELGTIEYMPPEIIRQGPQTVRSDMWSFACTAIELITGHPPWTGHANPWSIMFSVGQGLRPSLDLVTKSGVDIQLVKILESCLNPDEQLRPNAPFLLHSEYVHNMMTLHR